VRLDIFPSKHERQQMFRIAAGEPACKVFQAISKNWVETQKEKEAK